MKTDTMQIRDVEAYARQLFTEIGRRSVAVVDRRVAEAATAGRDDHAEKWRSIKRVLIRLRDGEAS